MARFEDDSYIKIVATFDITGRNQAQILSSFNSNAKAPVETEIDTFFTRISGTNTDRTKFKIKVAEISTNRYEVYPKYILEADHTKTERQLSTEHDRMAGNIRVRLRDWLGSIGINTAQIQWHIHWRLSGKKLDLTGDERP